jgi:hypothetical protein
MKITIKQAIQKLEECAAIILPDETGAPLMYPSVDADDDIFLSMKWTDDEGLEYQSEVSKGGNVEVEMSGGILVLRDTEGSLVRILLLVPMVGDESQTD